MTSPGQPRPGSSRSGYLVVAGAEAGSVEHDNLDPATQVLASEGPIELAATSSAADLDRALDRRGERTLVIAGGDGTLHVVVDRLWQRGDLGHGSIGLIPLGTGNDFARGVGLPLDPARAADVIVEGHHRPLDLLVTGTREAVVNVAHVGLGAEAAEVASGMKQFLGPLAYAIGALVAGVRASGWELSVALDDTEVHDPDDGKVAMVVVANGSSIGGGTPVAPRARPDDGLVDLTVVTGRGPIARAGFARALRRGSHLERPDVAHHRGRRVRITGDPVPHNVDGELTEPLRSRSYEVAARAWSLFTPSCA